MFNINFNILVEQLTPSFLRYPKMLAWVKCLVVPVNYLYLELQSYRLVTLKKIEYTGQIIYLEKLLNDAYITIDTPYPIFIEDVANIEYFYLSNKIEGLPPVCISNKDENNTPVYIGNATEYITNCEFIVKIPQFVYDALTTADLNQMKTLINFYKIAGKRFIIQSY